MLTLRAPERFGGVPWRAIAFGALVLLGTGACGGAVHPSASAVLAAGWIDVTGNGGLDWLDATHLVASKSTDPANPAAPYRLVSIGIADQRSVDLALPSLADCQRTEYLQPTRLSDGRLASVRRCIPLKPPFYDWPTWLIALDSSPGGFVELTTNLSPGTVLNIAKFAWDPARNEGALSIGSRICQSIQAIGSSGITPLHVAAEIDGRTFFLDEDPSPGGDDCTTYGRADDPSLSPNDSVLAFFASTAAIGRGGEDRLDAPGALMTVPVGSDRATVLVSGLTNVVGVSWSPDGRCLAFGGSMAGSGAGTFVVDAHTGAAVKTSDIAVSPRWSPDGQSLSGVVVDADGSHEWAIVLAANCPR